ncbi:hypothetical protein BH18ACT3_BH18ACT3_14040 [soil metagenome]
MPPTADARRRSLSTLRRLIRDAERDLAELEHRREQLAEALTKATADHQALAQIGTEMAEVQAGLGEAEQRWLTLSDELDTA